MKPEQGIQSGPYTPNRRVVGLLLASPEVEALDFVRRHANNRPWLEMAMEIEDAKPKPRKAVLDAIRASLNPPATKPIPRREPLDARACKDG